MNKEKTGNKIISKADLKRVRGGADLVSNQIIREITVVKPVPACTMIKPIPAISIVFPDIYIPVRF